MRYFGQAGLLVIKIGIFILVSQELTENSQWSVREKEGKRERERVRKKK